MTSELWPQEIWLCQGVDCGLRFPARTDEPRAQTCPLCDSDTEMIEGFDRPPASQHSKAGPTVTQLTVILDNIRSANNVGSIIRTADAVGAAVAFGGFTATPDNPKVAKTSLGAHESVSWSRHMNTLEYVEGLLTQGTAIWALEATTESVPIETVRLPEGPLGLVVGNEVSGVDPGILRAASMTVHLPMIGTKTSLNVAVAMGAAVYILQGKAVRS